MGEILGATFVVSFILFPNLILNFPVDPAVFEVLAKKSASLNSLTFFCDNYISCYIVLLLSVLQYTNIAAADHLLQHLRETSVRRWYVSVEYCNTVL